MGDAYLLSKIEQALRAADYLLKPSMEPVVGTHLRRELTASTNAWKTIQRRLDQNATGQKGNHHKIPGRA